MSLRDEIDPSVLTYRKVLGALDLLKRQPGPTIDASFEVVGEPVKPGYLLGALANVG